MSNSVYRAANTSSGVYHTDIQCTYLQHDDGDIIEVPQSEIRDTWRECTKCEYRDIPALD